MIERLPMSKSSAGQVAHEQHGDTAADMSDEHMLRADTEYHLADDHISAEQPTPGNSYLQTSHLPTIARSDNSLTSEASPTWKAHHQDFYLSKWFRSILIFIIVSVILAALVVYVFASPIVDVDLFGNYYILTLTFVSPIFIVLCISTGGIFKSKVFR